MIKRMTISAALLATTMGLQAQKAMTPPQD